MANPSKNTSPTELVLPSPAKLNLFLHVCGQRDDGYHNLQTVFQFVDYCDTLTFRLREDNQLRLLTPLNGINPEDNLIIRAARLLQKQIPSQPGADIQIDKKLPIGGGIGGGSSNAATTLAALNRLWQCHFSRSQLQEIGLQLGADVPIFIYGEAAWAEGVGERLQSIDLAEPWYLVIAPPCHVSTAEIFSHKQLTRNTQPIRIAAFLEHGGQNDCEALVSSLYPEVSSALTWLNRFNPARMTGTGACVFAQFATQREAQDVLRQLPNSLQGFIARGANQSPLYKAMNKLN